MTENEWPLKNLIFFICCFTHILFNCISSKYRVRQSFDIGKPTIVKINMPIRYIFFSHLTKWLRLCLQSFPKAPQPPQPAQPFFLTFSFVNLPFLTVWVWLISSWLASVTLSSARHFISNRFILFFIHSLLPHYLFRWYSWCLIKSSPSLSRQWNIPWLLNRRNEIKSYSLGDYEQ